MRFAWCLALACAACAGGATPRGDSTAEQARFDRDRHPDRVVAALDLAPGDTVADVGAGTGLMTVHLARAVGPHGRVVATDVDANALAALTRRMRRAGVAPRVEPRPVAPATPSLERAAFDAVLLARVDHYLPDRVAWLRAAAPALRPDGRLVITNRIHHRAEALAAATAAGWHLEAEATVVPGEYLAVFRKEASP